MIGGGDHILPPQKKKGQSARQKWLRGTTFVMKKGDGVSYRK